MKQGSHFKAAMSQLQEMEPLNCNGCTACCRNKQAIVLRAPDKASDYEHVTWAPAPADVAVALQRENRETLFSIEMLETMGFPKEFLDIVRQYSGFAVAQLETRENGDCIYLGKDGCTIYDRRPTMCRGFDCRILFLSQTRNERRDWIKAGTFSREVYAAGRKRGEDRMP